MGHCCSTPEVQEKPKRISRKSIHVNFDQIISYRVLRIVSVEHVGNKSSLVKLERSFQADDPKEILFNYHVSKEVTGMYINITEFKKTGKLLLVR